MELGGGLEAFRARDLQEFVSKVARVQERKPQESQYRITKMYFSA
jgi:hypothetical protein